MDIRLISWQQRIEEYRGDGAVYRVAEFIGADPLLIRVPKGVRVLIQSGEAVGDTVRPMPAEPVIEDAIMLDKPRVTFGPDDFLELKVSWLYVMVLDSEDDINTANLDAWMTEPATPEFYE